jgi:heat shock protein HslJ
MKKLLTGFIFFFLLTLMLSVTSLAQQPDPCQAEYVVQAGDWLSKIAEKYYGHPLAYEQIISATNSQSGDKFTTIQNPDLIEPGWVLCIPAADVVAELMSLAPNAPPGLSPQALANATYKSQYTPSGSVTLQNGRFSEPAAPGSATQIIIQMTRHLAYGEMNGKPAAALVLVSDPGGSGTFYDLHLMFSADGRTPLNPAAVLLGDRVKLNKVSIENNLIVVDMVQAGPDDPLCCPSQHVIKTYEWQKDQLVEKSSQVVESSPELVGTVWRWEQTLMNSGAKLAPDNPNSYTVEFKPDGTVAIQADCNQVGGNYTLEGSSITIELGPSTLAACPEGSLGDPFIRHLGAVGAYFFQDADLFMDLLVDGGTMKFTAQSTNLAGTSWRVTGYNNGQGGVVSPIIGAELTATFGADGNLTGLAGCNNYTAPYQIDGSKMVIGPAAATRKACAQPEGIMDQELQVLTALMTAATYQMRGDLLELRTAEGALAATFETAK